MQVVKFMLVACLVALSCSPKQTDNPQLITDTEVTIAKDLIQGVFDNVWGGIDTSQVLKYQTPDFYILEQGEVWDNERIKAYMLSQKARENRPQRVNKMDYLTIDKHGQALNIAYNNYAEFYQGDSLVGEAQWLESALAIPTKDGWRLRTMHSTRVRK